MKLNDIVDLLESGDTRADSISWVKSNNKFIGDFTDNGVKYQIHVVHFPTNGPVYGFIQNKLMYNIQFCIDDESKTSNAEKTKITNYRNSIRVFGIVQSETLHKLVQEGITPDILILSIATVQEHNTKEQVQSRLSLYTRLANSAGRKFGYPYIYSPLYTPESVNVFMTNFEITPSQLALVKETLKKVKKNYAV